MWLSDSFTLKDGGRGRSKDAATISDGMGHRRGRFRLMALPDSFTLKEGSLMTVSVSFTGSSVTTVTKRTYMKLNKFGTKLLDPKQIDIRKHYTKSQSSSSKRSIVK